MIKFAVSFLALFLFACSGAPTGSGIGGQDGKSGGDGESGEDGTSGLSGENGTAGKDGADGKSGTDNHIQTTWICNAVIAPFTPVRVDEFPGPGMGPPFVVKLSLWYQVSITTYGDVFARAGADSYAGYGGYGFSGPVGNQSTVFYAKDSELAPQAYVAFLQNVLSMNHSESDAAGRWQFSLNRNTNVATAVYTDTDLKDGKWNFKTNCSVK